MLFKLLQIIGKDGNLPEAFDILLNSSLQKLNQISHKEHK